MQANECVGRGLVLFCLFFSFLVVFVFKIIISGISSANTSKCKSFLPGTRLTLVRTGRPSPGGPATPPRRFLGIVVLRSAAPGWPPRRSRSRNYAARQARSPGTPGAAAALPVAAAGAPRRRGRAAGTGAASGGTAAAAPGQGSSAGAALEGLGE